MASSNTTHQRAPSWRVSSAVRDASRSTPHAGRAARDRFVDLSDVEQEIEDDDDSGAIHFQNATRSYLHRRQKQGKIAIIP